MPHTEVYVERGHALEASGHRAETEVLNWRKTCYKTLGQTGHSVAGEWVIVSRPKQTDSEKLRKPVDRLNL